MSDYSEKLKDPRWQRRRLEVLEARGWHCELCRKDDQSLHVHHLSYRPTLEPWEYGDKDLIVLCENCHEEVHTSNISERLVRIFSKQFEAGERHAIQMMSFPEGSDERYEYLKSKT